MKTTDLIVSESRGSVEQALTYAKANGAKREDFVIEYATALWGMCKQNGFDFSILWAQADLESDSFKSPLFVAKGNTVGLGRTDTQDLSLTYARGTDMARAHCVHMYVYVFGEIPTSHALYKYRPLDPRYQAVISANWDGTVRTIHDLHGKWASLKTTNPDYDARIVSRGNRIFGDTPQQEGPNMANVYGKVPFFNPDMLIVSKPVVQSGYGYDSVPPRNIIGDVKHETMGYGTGEFYRGFFGPGGERYTNALVDFVIEKNGRICMLNDPFGTRAPWANGGGVGLPGGLEGDGPRFVTLFGTNAINTRLISIEYVKLDNERLTPAQVTSGGRVTAYYHDKARHPWQEYPYVPELDAVMSFLHFEFGTTNCGVGPQEMADTHLVQSAAKGIMKQYQSSGDGEPVPPEVPPLPEPALPGGISVAKAKAQFGSVEKYGPDGKLISTGGFDPKGIISLGWAQRCAQEKLPFDEWPGVGRWQIIKETGADETLDVLTWENDWLMVRKSVRGSFQWV